MKISNSMIIAFLLALVFMWIILKGVTVTPVTTPIVVSTPSPDLSGGSIPENPETELVSQGY